MAQWLVGAAGRMPPELAEVTLGLLLGQPEATLDDQRLRDLLDLARRLPVSPQVDQLERLLAVRAIGRIARGERAVPVVFASPAAAVARNLVLQFLHRATPMQAAAALDWAAASGVDLPDDSLRRYGRTRLDPDLPAAELAAVVRRHLAIRRGLLERLAGEPPEVARAVLGGPVGTQLEHADLAGHPELTELWLLQSAAAGPHPADARLRRDRGHPRRRRTLPPDGRGRCCTCCGRAAARRTTSRNCSASSPTRPRPTSSAGSRPS